MTAELHRSFAAAATIVRWCSAPEGHSRDDEIRPIEVQAGGELGKLHRPTASVAVRIVDQCAGRGIVDDAVIGNVRRSADVKERIAAERGKDRRRKLDV